MLLRTTHAIDFRYCQQKFQLLSWETIFSAIVVNPQVAN